MTTKMDQLIPIQDWGLPMERLFLAAGPCSAETEEQVMRTAEGLKDAGISFFRAGIWKPRTRPGQFEGIGAKALKWLVRCRDEFGMAIGAEVASPEHLKACLDHNIDIVWIGARTTVNPFAVQDLADVLDGTDLPVLVKNPVSPDLELWIGAMERIYNAGIHKLGALHRGFMSSKKVIYRNTPHWSIPIELKRRIPHMPLVCDPSHICGRADLIPAIAQEALDLLYQGLMIEVHENPPDALSDASQQLTPSQFKNLLAQLTLKHESDEDLKFRQQLQELRMQIDSVDEHLLKLLGNRMEIVDKLGALKEEHQVSALQPGRWEEILSSRTAIGKNYSLSKQFVFKLFEAIHEEAIQHQEHAPEED